MGSGGGGGGDAEVGFPSGAGGAEGEFRTAKTSVWWDIENCQVPKGWDAHTVAKNISTALANMGYKGMVSISAYGDTNKIAFAVQQALCSTGISLNHVPAGVKDASDKKILVDMLFWAVDNPPPANYLLISGDRDFSNALHQLRMRRYNVLLAHAPNVSQALVAAAKCVWLWTSLLAGDLPLNNESSRNSNISSNSFSCAEPSRVAVSEPRQQMVPPENIQTNQKGYTNGKFDKRFKGKQTSTGQNGLKHSNLTDKLNDGNSDNVLKSNHMQWPNQVLNSVAQTSQPLECKQLNIGNSFSPPIPVTLPCEPGKLPQNYSETKLIKEAPHKFFGALNVNSGPMTKVSSSMPDYPPNSYPVRPQPPHLLRPSDLHSTQTTLTSGNLYEPVSSQQPPKHAVPTPFNSSPSPMLPDMNRLNISEYPRGVNNTSYYQNPDARPGFVPNPSSSVRIVHPLPNFAPSFRQRPEFRRPAAPVNGNSFNNGDWGMPACPQPSSEVQFHIGNILRALYILKTDKMMPTEANIADCIHYGEINLPNFNVSLGLDHAIRHNMIVKHSLGASLPLYVGKNDKLWKCVNIMDWNDKHPKETWDAIQTFITSTNGRAAILATQCRYQAAIILKKNCLKNQVMGNVLQILNMSIHNKKWITPHFSGWQPLSIKLPVSLDIDI